MLWCQQKKNQLYKKSENMDLKFINPKFRGPKIQIFYGRELG